MTGLRKAVASHLATETGFPVLAPFTASRNTTRPYLVVKYVGNIRAASTPGGWDRFEVWTYVDPDSALSLDEAVQAVVDALDDKALATDDARTLRCSYVNEGPDFYDEDVGALTRYAQFRFPKL